MNFLFELTTTQPNADGKNHGGGFYGEIIYRELLDRLDSTSGIHFFAVFDSRRPIDSRLLRLSGERGVTLIDERELSVIAAIQKFRIDRFYSPVPYHLSYASQITCPFFGTLHGLRPLEMYSDSRAPLYETKLLKKIKKLIQSHMQKFLSENRERVHFLALFDNPHFYPITVSKHSEYAIRYFFPEFKKVIPVFYSPSQTLKSESADLQGALPEGVCPHQYFLLVSGNRWIKNGLRAALAFDQLVSAFDLPFQFVITGVKKSSVYQRHLKHADHFLFLDYVDRSALDQLHRNAYALIYPSLNEGFGYPPMESMRYGIPVAASGISSIPEVCGDAALYFDPYSIPEIANRMLQLLDDDIYNQMKAMSLRRYEVVSARQREGLRSMVDYLLVD